MSNNSSDAHSQCILPRSYGTTATFVTYTVLFPTHFFTRLLINSLCIFAFRRKAKHDAAFTFQLTMMVNQIVQISIATYYAVSFYSWSGGAGRGVVWFQSCHACMWYSAHLSIPLASACFTNALLLTLATSIDRVFAMGKPFVYKNINHKRHQLVAALVCTSISIGINAFDAFRLYPKLGEDRLYSIVVDTEYTQSMVALVLTRLRDVARVAATLLLVVSNVAVVILYKRYVRKIKDMTSSNSVDAKRKLAQEKVLVLLSVAESIFYVLAMMFLTTYYALVYAVPSFFECDSALIGSLTDGFIKVFDTFDFFIVLAVSQTFRSMLAKTLPQCVRSVFTTTGTTS